MRRDVGHLDRVKGNSGWKHIMMECCVGMCGRSATPATTTAHSTMADVVHGRLLDGR